MPPSAEQGQAEGIQPHLCFALWFCNGCHGWDSNWQRNTAGTIYIYKSLLLALDSARFEFTLKMRLNRKMPEIPVSPLKLQLLLNWYDVCVMFFDCNKRLESLNLLNHRTSTFVLKTVSSTDIHRKVNKQIQMWWQNF